MIWTSSTKELGMCEPPRYLFTGTTSGDMIAIEASLTKDMSVLTAVEREGFVQAMVDYINGLPGFICDSAYFQNVVNNNVMP